MVHRMITRAMAAMMALALGCGSAAERPDPPPVDASADATAVPFEAFSRTTRAIDIEVDSSALVVMATDVPGSLGCALAKETASPGKAAALVFAKLDTGISTQCPVGSYTLDGDPSFCRTTTGPGRLRAGCAEYRRWNDAGTEVGALLATTGYAKVTETPLANDRTRCTVDLQLQFPGGRSWSDIISVEYGFAASPPFCIESTCGAACEPWQSCTAAGACEDVACIDPGSACPADGSPACCTFGDPYRQLACNEPPDSPGTRSCCVALGDLCRYDGDCCRPHSCVLNQLGTHTCR